MADGTPTQPTLSELLSSYLGRNAESPAVVVGEVIPFESAPVHPVEPRVAWDGATLAAKYVPECNPEQWKMPPQWSALVAGHEPVMALPLCLGNFAQLVRDVHGLLHAHKLSALRPMRTRSATAPSLDVAEAAFKQKQHGPFLLAAGMLRLAKQFDAAEKLFEEHHADLPAVWQPALANERAALAWHRGDAEKAAGLWAAQEPSVPVLFNRGMTALFSDRTAEAKDPLVRAVEQLPDDDAWHQLGRLYLALAGTRS